MKKWRFLSLCLIISLILVLHPVSKVNASSDKFKKLQIETMFNPFTTDKTQCVITWKSTKEIQYLEVSITLENNKGELFTVYNDKASESDKTNATRSFKSVKNLKETDPNYQYDNTLEFELDNYQAGTMEISFTYSYEILPDTSDSEKLLQCTYIISSGIWTEKQTVTTSIIVGVIVTLVCGVVTYIIIENSQRTLPILKGIDSEDDE